MQKTKLKLNSWNLLEVSLWNWIQFDKVDGIGFEKPHVHKNFKFLYGNAPIIDYQHVPLLLTTNIVLALSVFNV